MDKIDGGVMLASNWDDRDDPSNFWMSEKLDGIRAYWNGEGLYTRNGNRINAPKWFCKMLPSRARLDGELWKGYGRFGDTWGAVSKKVCKPYEWSDMTFQVFDSPDAGLEPFERRLMYACNMVNFAANSWSESRPHTGPEPQPCPIRVVNHLLCDDKEHMESFHEEVVSRGGEGLILRAKMSPYERKRSHLLRKVKLFHDAEAVVIGYTESERREFRALHCTLCSDPSIEFDVGSGLSDRDLKNPPVIGSMITFKYQSFQESGKPRHPSFLRVKRNV